jgi:hypothetical protein
MQMKKNNGCYKKIETEVTETKLAKLNFFDFIIYIFLCIFSLGGAYFLKLVIQKAIIDAVNTE